MKRMLILTTGLLMAATGLRAQTAPAKPADLTTLSGRIYKNARAGTVDPDGITYFYAGGVAKIPFTDLPEEIRRKYNYDPAKAAAFARADDNEQMAAWQAGQQQNVQAQQREKEKTLAIVKDQQTRKLAGAAQQYAAQNKEHFVVEWTSAEKGGFFVRLKPCAVRSYSNSDAADSQGLNRTSYYVKDPDRESFRAFLVWDPEKNPVSDEEFQIDAFLCGSYVSDGHKYPKYSTDPADLVAAANK